MSTVEAPRYIDGIRAALADEMERDERVVVVGVDVAAGGVYSATRGLLDRFGPDRVIDTPIAESGVLGAMVGAAMAGLRPVVEIMYMDFITVCLDPIVNQAAKLRYMTGGRVEMPIVFRTQTGAGRSSGAQHSQSLEGMLAHVPGLKVYLPANARDVHDLTVAAIRDNSPVVLVENRRLYATRDEDWDRATLGPGVARLVRAGRDVTVVAWGRMVEQAQQAAKMLQPDLDVEVIDLRTLAPLDLETVTESLRHTGRGLIVHEAVEAFGPGAEIASRLTERLLFEIEGPIRRLGAASSPVPYSPPLEGSAIPDANAIAAGVRSLAAD